MWVVHMMKWHFNESAAFGHAQLCTCITDPFSYTKDGSIFEQTVLLLIIAWLIEHNNTHSKLYILKNV